MRCLKLCIQTSHALISCACRWTVKNSFEKNPWIPFFISNLELSLAQTVCWLLQQLLLTILVYFHQLVVYQHSFPLQLVVCQVDEMDQKRIQIFLIDLWKLMKLSQQQSISCSITWLFRSLTIMISRVSMCQTKVQFTRITNKWNQLFLLALRLVASVTKHLFLLSNLHKKNVAQKGIDTSPVLCTY